MFKTWGEVEKELEEIVKSLPPLNMTPEEIEKAFWEAYEEDYESYLNPKD